MNKSFKHIKKAIKEANKIALFCHIDPDFDALSSMYSLAFALKGQGKTVQMFTHEKFNFNQKVLLDESLVKIGGLKPNNFDLLISVDTPDIKRLGIYGQDFLNHPNTIKLDHHPFVEEMAKLSYVDTTLPSCSEIILELLDYMKIKITPQIATILYLGLCADTNTFTNTNVSAKSLEDGVELIKKGADIVKVNDVNTRMQSLVRLKVNKIFYRNLQIINKHIAVSTISHRELLAAGAQKRDVGGFSDQLLNYDGVKISCMIVEREPHVFDLSFRSMPEYDSSVIAQKFNGGGHKGAAGAIITGFEDIKEAKKQIVQEIKKYLKSRDAND